MVAGRLREKRGIYQMILPYVDGDNITQEKSISTGLPVKNNKRNAEITLRIVENIFDTQNVEISLAFLKRHIKNGTIRDISQEDYNKELNLINQEKSGAPFFTSWLHIWLEHWLNINKKGKKDVTYAGYLSYIDKIIIPFFQEIEKKNGKRLMLSEITVDMIESFYSYITVIRGNTVNTLRHHIVILNCAFRHGMKKEHIEKNPIDLAEKPKNEKTFVGQAWTDEQVDYLFQVAKGTKFELPILAAAYYGCRRGECLALRESATNWNSEEITIDQVLSEYVLDGKTVYEFKDTTKNDETKRYPLYPEVKDCIVRLKQRNAEYKKLLGSSYNQDYLDYYNLDEYGHIVRPSYISREFSKFLKKNGLPPLRFHDLRHTCGTRLYRETKDLLLVQSYLRHKQLSTTEIYVHLSNEQVNRASEVFSVSYGGQKKVLKPE